ncbi:hypothetical protein E4U43_001509 [Claviceps pusilla]|uniref:Uncharacterized protein n=1 Tax=Claviceps pusilla TaxID=123648 RepID=A0A9P7SY66_9HYPO|nr:hypothetical protein E4U43_001509 [Claviceps pusilla]
MPGVDSQGPAHPGGGMWDGRAGTGCWVGVYGGVLGALRGSGMVVWCWCGAGVATTPPCWGAGALGRWGRRGSPGFAGPPSNKVALGLCLCIAKVQSARACLHCNAACLLSLRDTHACRSGLCLVSHATSIHSMSDWFMNNVHLDDDNLAMHKTIANDTNKPLKRVRLHDNNGKPSGN